MAGENKIQEFLESIQDFELSEVNFDDIGQAPVALRVTLAVLAAVLTIVAGYTFFVSKQVAILKAEKQTTLQLKDKYVLAVRSSANLEEYREQVEKVEHELSVLVSQLPNDTEVPGLLDDITDEGVGNGLDFSSIGLAPEVKTDIYVELPINIDLRGAYHNIASFVSGIASLSRIVTVHDFSIAPVSNTSNSLLKMSLVAKTYRYDEKTQNKAP